MKISEKIRKRRRQYEIRLCDDAAVESVLNLCEDNNPGIEMKSPPVSWIEICYNEMGALLYDKTKKTANLLYRYAETLFDISC